MKDPLVLAGIVAFSVGIVLGSFSTPGWLILPGFLLALLFFGAWFFGKRDTYLYPTVLVACLVLGLLRTDVVPRDVPKAFVPLLDTSATLSGTISADPDVRETSQRITVDVSEGSVHTNVLVVADRYPAFAYGDRVSVSGVLTRPQPFATDGGREFAYDRFLAKDGIFTLMPRAYVKRIGEDSSIPSQALRILFTGKHAFTNALETALPEPEASLAEGLIAGGKQGLGKALLEAFTIAGLLPIVVLSGYNVMIVAEAVLACLAFLPKRLALVLAGATVTLFVLSAGGGSSALRAGIMACLALFARASGRTYAALRALLAVFVLMLLLNPLLLVADPGFQFSFVATLGLIILSSHLEVRLVRIRPKWLREIVSTTLSAQLFVLPLLIYQTGNFSLVAVPANVLVLPVVPFAMALSAVAGLAGLVVPPVATFVALPAYAFLSYIVGVAEVASRLPFANVTIPAFPFWLLAVPYVGIFWLVAKIRKTAPTGVGAVSRTEGVTP